MRGVALSYGASNPLAPDHAESNADEAFREAARDRAAATRAMYGNLLNGACALWSEIDGMCDDEGWAALREIVRFLKLDPLAYATYLEYRAGINTPQTEMVEAHINEADRAAKIAAELKAAA